MIPLPLEPLDALAFRPFGEVIRADPQARHYPINQGSTERYHDLAQVDVDAHGGRTLVNIFRAQPRALPCAVHMMERHPLGSQAFVPLGTAPYLVVVAPPGALDETALRAFLVRDGSGVNYARGVWHHPLLALQEVSDFLVIDRGGPGHNLDEITLTTPRWLELAPALHE